MEGAFSFRGGWGAELSFGQPPSAYDLGVGTEQREGSMNKDIHHLNSKGDPECPHPPRSVDHTWKHLLTPRPWVRQGLVSGWNPGHLGDHIRPEAGASHYWGRTRAWPAGDGFITDRPAYPTPVPDTADWVQ